MWKCPKCCRDFKNTNQDHYCGIIETIDQYIAEQPESIQPILQKIRETISAAAPNAVEKISWRMPTFWQGENIIHFAAFKKHVSIFPGSEATAFFADMLTEYKTAKGTVQFQLNKPIPFCLITDMTYWRVSYIENRHKPNKQTYEYETVIQPADKGGAYVVFPYDIRKEFGKGRIKVHASFDGEPYDGSVVNMGVKNPDGSVCYIIGVRKEIREKIGKQAGDIVKVIINLL